MQQLLHLARQTAGQAGPPSPPSGERAGVRGPQIANRKWQIANPDGPLTLILSPGGGEETLQRGFSRLELLVVLAVLAVLTGLLLPALARESARDSRAFCLHRLGQLARALAMYAVEAKDYLPPNPDDGNTTPYNNWCGGQAGAMQAQEFNPDILRDPMRALLTQYMGGNISYYKCPADLRTGRYQGSDVQRRGQIIPSVRTVSLNNAVGTNPNVNRCKSPVNGPWLDGLHGHTANRTWYCYGRMSDFVCPGPAHTFTFIEEDANSLNDSVFAVAGLKDPPIFAMIDWPATYHDVAGAVAFADGHVEMHRWLDKRTPVLKSVSVATQPGNPDILWLSERASALVVRP